MPYQQNQWPKITWTLVSTSLFSTATYSDLLQKLSKEIEVNQYLGLLTKGSGNIKVGRVIAGLCS